MLLAPLMHPIYGEGTCMGLDSLKHEIARESEREAKKLIDAADEQGKDIARSSEKDAKSKEKRAASEIEETLASEKSERIAAARLDAKKILSQAREEAIASALDKVWAEFVKISKGKDYSALLNAIIKKGADEIGGDCRVYVRKEDKTIAKDAGVEVSEKSIDCAGGAIVEGKDGKVRVNSTFEQLFEEKKDDIRKDLYAKLFSDEE